VLGVVVVVVAAVIVVVSTGSVTVVVVVAGSITVRFGSVAFFPFALSELPGEFGFWDSERAVNASALSPPPPQATRPAANAKAQNIRKILVLITLLDTIAYFMGPPSYTRPLAWC
jgi:hypothetical protein